MFRKFTIVALPALIFALATFSANDSASQAVARGGGHGGGHRGGGHRSVSHIGGHRSGGHNRSRARNHGKGNRHNHRHGHRYRGYGWGYGFEGDGDFAALADAAVPDSITLLNPQETRRTVAYTLDSAQYSLDPAQSQVYEGDTRLIVFDRGGSFGQAQYTLQPGAYRFIATDRGWDLRTVTEQVAAN